MPMQQRGLWWVAGQTSAWIVSHPVEAVGATALLANPTTRTWAAKTGWMVAKETARFTGRVALRTAVITNAELVAGSRLATVGGTAGIYAAAFGAGVFLGAIVGTGVAYAGWGSEGASDAVRLYSGQVGWEEYISTVGKLF
jgi:hypothetical protein